MLDWLKGWRRAKSSPEYSELRSAPDRGIPADLADMEASESFMVRRQTIEEELREPTRRPPQDKPLFTELMTGDKGGVVTIDLPNKEERCLPVFSTPFRSADYVQVLLASGPSVSYLVSSAFDLVRMLRDLESMGIRAFVMDRCPRCSVFTVFSSGSFQSADDLLNAWAIVKATEMARADLYLRFALESARAGQLNIARDVALQTVGHVSLEDPRSHFLLGQLALVLGDRRLLHDAKAFLQFLHLELWARKLDRVVESGRPNFEHLGLNGEVI